MINNELDIFARTIYGEARGESVEGKIAVANVILNRVKAANEHKIKQYGDGSIASCCKAPWQFSCWNPLDPNLDKIKSVDHTDSAFIVCITIAKAAISGLLVDNTKGAKHYHTNSMGFPKAWKKPNESEKKPVVIIGNHSFYNNVK